MPFRIRKCVPNSHNRRGCSQNLIPHGHKIRCVRRKRWKFFVPGMSQELLIDAFYETLIPVTPRGIFSPTLVRTSRSRRTDSSNPLRPGRTVFPAALTPPTRAGSSFVNDTSNTGGGRTGGSKAQMDSKISCNLERNRCKSACNPLRPLPLRSSEAEGGFWDIPDSDLKNVLIVDDNEKK